MIHEGAYALGALVEARRKVPSMPLYSANLP